MEFELPSAKNAKEAELFNERLHYVKRLLPAYPLLQMAIDALKPNSTERIWAIEKPKIVTGRSGCRVFFVATVEDFYVHIYSNKELYPFLAWYEILLENVPLKPYFDLEFYTDLNKNINTEPSMLNKLVQKMCNVIIHEFKLKYAGHLECKDVIILESHNKHKISWHFIFSSTSDELPLCFEREDAMRFAKEVIFALGSSVRIVDKSNKQSSMIDLSVYSRKYNFRLMNSFKADEFEKPRRLVPARDFHSNVDTNSRQFFERSLIIPVTYKIKSKYPAMVRRQTSIIRSPQILKDKNQIDMECSKKLEKLAIDESKKYEKFVNQSMKNKHVTEIAGVNQICGERLIKKGYDQASVLFGQYLLLKEDDELFVDYLRDEFGFDAKSAFQCFKCLNEWANQNL